MTAVLEARQEPSHTDAPRTFPFLYAAQAAGTIKWMMENAGKQLTRFASKDKSPTMLTELSDKHEEPVRVFLETLEALHGVLTGTSDGDAPALYRHARNLADVPAPEGKTKLQSEHPLQYYFQLLEWHPNFAAMRRAE